MEQFQGSTKICKDSVALLKEALIMVRNISCWVVVCSLVSSVPQALVEIPADMEVWWWGVFFAGLSWLNQFWNRTEGL